MIVNRTIDILREYETYAKKRFGQNFLISSDILNRITKVANLTKDDCVIEIGPGIGSLTEFIAKTSKQVITYEIDDDMVNILNDTLKEYDNVKIIHKDFLDVDISKDICSIFGENINAKVVANIPYYITTPILFKLLESPNVSDMCFMVQKELADRFTGKPKTKDYNALSVIINYKCEAKIAFSVPRNFFYPVPNVDSAILVLKRKQIDYGINNEAKFFEFVQALFSMRRKTIVNNLSSSFSKYTKEDIKNKLISINLKETCRAEELDLEKIIELYKCFD